MHEWVVCIRMMPMIWRWDDMQWHGNRRRNVTLTRKQNDHGTTSSIINFNSRANKRHLFNKALTICRKNLGKHIKTLANSMKILAQSASSSSTFSKDYNEAWFSIFGASQNKLSI
jgi:hypothetical protein